MAEKCWIIANLVDCCEIDSTIPERKRPKFVHFNKAEAETELLRLQSKYTAGEFVLFESIAEARPGLYERGLCFVEDL